MKWAFGHPIYPVKIHLPPLATQQAIVAEIEAEQALVAANRELMARFEQKIQATLARVWGEDSDSANGAPPSQPGATPQSSFFEFFAFSGGYFTCRI